MQRAYRVVWAVVDVWLAAVAVLCVYCAFTTAFTSWGFAFGTGAVALLVLVLTNLVFAFPVMRNYAEFTASGELVVAYGPIVDRMPVETVRLVEEIDGVRGFLATASLSKVRIVGRRTSVMIAVSDRGGFLDEVARRCPGARIVRTGHAAPPHRGRSDA